LPKVQISRWYRDLAILQIPKQYHSFLEISKILISLLYRYFGEDKFFTDIILDICNLGSLAISWSFPKKERARSFVDFALVVIFFGLTCQNKADYLMI